VHGDLDVRATFALSYRALDDSAKAMLRRVSLLCTPDFPVSAAAALLDIGATEAEDVCERLVDAQLMDAAPRPGAAEPRYRMHDLVRAFARERAMADEPPEARNAALARVFGCLLGLAEHAHTEVYGGDFTVLHGSAPRWTVHSPDLLRAIGDDPLGWLDGERHSIMAAVQQGAEMGLDELCWDLAWTAVTLYENRGYTDDWLAAQTYAMNAVRKAGNKRGIAAMLAAKVSLGMTTGQLAEGEGLAEESLRLFTELGDVRGCAIARYRMTVRHVRSGRPGPALEEGRQALRDTEASGELYLQADRAAYRRGPCPPRARDPDRNPAPGCGQGLPPREHGHLRGTGLAPVAAGSLRGAARPGRGAVAHGFRMIAVC
jgi:hypothetical protein